MQTNNCEGKPQSDESIKIGRLERKIEKLNRKVNHYKEQCSHYKSVINLNPNLESRHKHYTEIMAERSRVRQLEERVLEQTKLIHLLEKEKEE